VREQAEKRVFEVRFADETKKEFRKLGPSATAEILSAVRKKLVDNPTGYGEPLVRELVGYRKLPVGQWRVVYSVEERKVLVLVLAIGKRAQGDYENIYEQVTKDDLTSRREALKRQMAEEEAERRNKLR
jgi:mRNA interferase RelE/StbE